MAYPGGLDLQALAKLNDIDPAAAGPAPLGARAIDSDGDGRPDLYLVDLDGDGAADGVVRAVDTDGDGVNDTFIQYNEEGVESIGRVDPATGELDVVYEEPDAFDELLGSLGLADLPSPEEALFTSFDDPYILETYGSFGVDVPEFYPAPEADAEPASADDLRVTEVEAEEAGETTASPAPDGGEAEPPEVVPRVVEIEDRGGGDGSSLWAKVDEDADGLADNDVRIEKTSTGTYYGDIDKDGYSEDVAKDSDADGRIDAVDTTGRGSSADTVGAERVVEPGSGHLVDRSPGEDDAAAGVGVSTDASEAGESDMADDGAGPEDGIASGSDYDAGISTSGGADDAGGSIDTDDGYDSGGSSGGDDTV